MFVEYPLLGAQELKSSLDHWLPLVENSAIKNGDRCQSLDALVGFIQEKMKTTAQEAVDLVFICTHNSRRSQLAQIWAQRIADDLGLNFVRCHSAGTERTAFHPNAIAALVNRGFVVESRRMGMHEIHEVSGPNGGGSIPCFSKTLEDSSLPQKGFIAITTCDDADRACPVISGSLCRLALPYSDPKVSDDTPNALETYARRSDEIAIEMLYVLGQVSKARRIAKNGRQHQPE